jgi:hypothetical protein
MYHGYVHVGNGLNVCVQVCPLVTLHPAACWYDCHVLGRVTAVLQQCKRNRVCATARIDRGDDVGRSGLRWVHAVCVQVDPQSP